MRPHVKPPLNLEKLDSQIAWLYKNIYNAMTIEADGDVIFLHDVTFMGAVIFDGFNQGSVLFADAAGAVDENNANFYWDDANTQLELADGTAALPSYTFHLDDTCGMYRIGGDIIGFSTNAVERLRIQNASVEFSVDADIDGNNVIMDLDGDTYFSGAVDDLIYAYFPLNGYHIFGYTYHAVQANSSAVAYTATCYSTTNTDLSYLNLRKSGHDTVGSLGTTVNDELFGLIQAWGVDSGPTALRVAASILFQQDGAAGAANVPGDMHFRTDNGAGMADRMAISAPGIVTITNTTNATSKDLGCLVIEGGLGLEKDIWTPGQIVIDSDANGLILGDTQLGKIYDNGTDLIIDPDAGGGAGIVKIGVTGNNNLHCDYLGVGNTAAPNTTYHINCQNSALNTTGEYQAIFAYHQKTAGVTDFNDQFVGVNSYIRLNQAGGEIGQMIGMNARVDVINGTVGNNPAGVKSAYGFYKLVRQTGGTVTLDVLGDYSEVDINGGTVGDDVYGMFVKIDVEAAATVTGDYRGLEIWMDADADPGGLAYMLYFSEYTNIDYCIYQSGTAPNLFGGITHYRDLQIGIHSQADSFLDLFADDCVRIANGADGVIDGTLKTKICEIAAAGELDCVTNGGYLKPRRVSQAAAPVPDTNELLIWRDTDDDKTYLVHNDPDVGVRMVETT